MKVLMVLLMCYVEQVAICNFPSYFLLETSKISDLNPVLEQIAPGVMFPHCRTFFMLHRFSPAH